MIDKLKFEIEFLKPVLPRLLDEAATEALVWETISTCGATSPPMVGKVVDAIMKDYRGKVDPILIKKITEKFLGVTS